MTQRKFKFRGWDNPAAKPGVFDLGEWGNYTIGKDYECDQSAVEMCDSKGIHQRDADGFIPTAEIPDDNCQVWVVDLMYFDEVA